jgi:hypothetical protein
LKNKYDNSLPLLLSTLHPNYDWLPWKFPIPKSFWDDLENQQKFMNWASKELKIHEMADWNKVSTTVSSLFCAFSPFQDLSAMGGRALLVKYGFSLTRLLKQVFPKHEWPSDKPLNAKGKKSQYLLTKALNAMFPEEGKRSLLLHIRFTVYIEVLEEYRHPDIVSQTGNLLELDYFYPKLNLAVEYQVTVTNKYGKFIFRGHSIIDM